MPVLMRESTITCPACGFAQAEAMPERSCAITYRCSQCGTDLWPAEGDCCVYCTYGSVPCQAMWRRRIAPLAYRIEHQRAGDAGLILGFRDEAARS